VNEMVWETEDLSVELRTTSRDGDYQEVTFAVRHGDFTAALLSTIDAGDAARFAAEVHQMWRDLSGEAELFGEHGLDFRLRLTMSTGGHVDVLVDVQQPTARLVVETQTDQTYLPALRDGMLSVG
jgi:hypothetical protein